MSALTVTIGVMAIIGWCILAILGILYFDG
jgi:hypothetical protein